MDHSFASLVLPARLESLEAFQDFVNAGAASAGLGQADIGLLELVLEEILMNIARYAYQPGTGDAEVRYAIQEPGKLLVEVSDGGRLFNPLAADPPPLGGTLSERPIGGLGVFLVKNLVGSLSYRREQNRNTVWFTFPGPDPAGA